MKTTKGYRFVTDNLSSQRGTTKWEVGKWQKLDNDKPLELCANGFHASRKPLDSLTYTFGTRWFVCEARGKILLDSDKFCATEMRLVSEIPERVIRQFAIDCAGRVLPVWEKQYPKDKRPREAIEAAQIYLDNPTEGNRERLAASQAAAWDASRDTSWAASQAAAGDASQAAAGAAAGDASRAAAGAAAWDASRDASGAASRDASWAASRKWQNRHLIYLIRKTL